MKHPLDCKVALAGAFFLAAAGLTGPAAAQEVPDAPAATQVAEQTPAREPTVLVCKVFAPTGSRIEHEYCLTEDDWDAIRQDSRETLERLMRTGAEV